MKPISLTIIVILANHQLLHLAVLAHLTPHILIKGIEMVLQLTGVHAVLRVEGGILVHVRHQDGLGVRGLDMLPGATIAMPAGTDLVVKGAIDLVLFRTENRREIVGHDVDCAVSLSSWVCDVGPDNTNKIKEKGYNKERWQGIIEE